MNPTLRRARLLAAWNAIGSVIHEVEWHWPRSQPLFDSLGRRRLGMTQDPARRTR